MKTIYSIALFCAAAVLPGAVGAQTTTIFSEDFSGANAGTQPNGPIAGTKFTSIGPNVDIVGQTANGGHFFDCIGNPGGACVDLVGNQGPGSTITSTPIALLSGDSYTLTFSDVLQGFNAGDPATSDYTVSIGSFSADLVSLGGIDTSRSFMFTADVSDPLATLAFHTTTAPDGVHGPVVQNIVLTQTTPSTTTVPEPATWAMMLVGFFTVGAGLRYRRKSTAVRFA